MPTFSKILIANRGEIACRIARSAQALGYRTVAVYSAADSGAPHVAACDQAVPIGPAELAQSYLNIARLIEACRLSGADAIHPGYGFLAENEAFAKACAEAGIVFIGPSPAAMRLMGNKAAAKRRMVKAGIPCVPGYQGRDQTDKTLAAKAAEIGFPVMVKAAAGGGGRGMRLVAAKGDLVAALGSARSEARNAFGSGELILEKAIIAPRHVEIQVFADGAGNAVHLGERDCSIQRRHQKVIEEAPSPAVTDHIRRQMGETAVSAAQAIDYTGAGTVEFLLEASGAFYFLEMNTRLQVEHPVTEAITGLDLVALQIRVAAGEPLPFAQEDIAFSGHAIEARLYAEDPHAGFLPQSGMVHRWKVPAGEGIRVDHGLRSGNEISPFADPMLAKIIAHGADRDEARRRLVRALRETVFFGPATNKAFLVACLDHPQFVRGKVATDFIDRHFGDLDGNRPRPDRVMLALAGVLFYEFALESGGGQAMLAGWRSSAFAASPLRLVHGEENFDIAISSVADGEYGVDLGGAAVAMSILERDELGIRFQSGGLEDSARYCIVDGELFLEIGGIAATFTEILRAGAAGAGAGNDAGLDGRVLAPMNAKVLAVHARKGDAVAAGQKLVVLEAMKMEHVVSAPVAGTVESVGTAVGDQVTPRKLLVQLAPAV